MTKRGEVTGCRKAGSGRLLAWYVAALLCLLAPIMARSAENEADTGLLRPPMADNKPVKVKVGFFLTNLIDVDEVKETFHISGYLFMSWKDPRLAFSPTGGAKDRSYNPDSIWIPRIFMVNAAVQREKTNITSSVAPRELYTTSNCSRRSSPPLSIWSPSPSTPSRWRCSWNRTSTSATN